MILDYEYSQEKKQMSISYIREDGNKEILHFDNISKFQTYYHTPSGRFTDWQGARCDIKWTQRPTNFDLHEFIENLSPEIQDKLNGKTFPKLYTFDIETKLKPGPKGEVGKGPFTNQSIADEPIHTISLVSPNLNAIVVGDKPLDENEIKWIENQFYNYLNSIPFYKTLSIDKPQFKYIYFDSEEKMLRWFLKIVSKTPIIAGWNSIDYDWRYITSRITNYFTDISISDASSTHTTRKKSYTNKRNEKIELKHPIHSLVLDMQDIIETEDTQVLPIKESMNLDYIAHESLGANKVDHSGQNLEVLYNEDFAKYVFYNLIDSILVQLIDKKFKTMDHIYMYSLYAKEMIGKCFSKIALTQALILRNYRQRGIKIVYERKDTPDRGRLIGAYVKTPIPGKHSMVVCNDFASLYPSTMRTTNVSFDNFVGTFYDEKKLKPYRDDPENYIVICASVYKNDGTYAKPEVGELIATYMDEEALAPYRADKNYFVTVNGHVYKNDQDYTLKRIMSELYDNRNYSKYLSKDLDAMVISDIDHIARGVDAKLHTYNQRMIDTMRAMGYNITCGDDLKKMHLEDMLEFERKLKTEIVYHANLEQAIKLMMNSVYGGTSHVSFYWFNMCLANDITGESRNLTHHMEDHLWDYWKKNWESMTEWHKKWGIEVDHKKCQEVFGADGYYPVVYGDTDSLYIEYGSLLKTIKGNEKFTLRDKLDIVLKINLEFLDNHNCEYIRDYYAARHGNSVHKFELETVSKSGVWLNVKKRYGQILLYKDGKYFDEDSLPVKVKGLEVIKSSYPTIAREQLKDMLRFLLEYDGKYLTQELNIRAQNHKKSFMDADLERICGNMGVQGYFKWVDNDDNPEGWSVKSGTPFGVKALAMYNWINNTKHYGSEPLYGGKIKYYTMKGSNDKNGDIYFAFEAMKYPSWGEKEAPVDRNRMYQKFVLDPFNRILSAIGMPILKSDGSIQMDLFSMF